MPLVLHSLQCCFYMMMPVQSFLTGSLFRISILLVILLPFSGLAQTDSLKSPASADTKTQTALQKDSLPRKNEKTILNQKGKKFDNSLDFKLNYAGHHLHKAGRNVIAVGGILVSSVAAVLLFNTVLKPRVDDDLLPIYTVYGGLGLSFILCSTKGGYHLVKAGKSLKDARFFKQDKTIYD